MRRSRETATPMSSPLVSIIMNCYNCANYVRDAIDSVYRQTYGNWEIIFLDNCSTDRSAEIAGSFDERLRYVRTDRTIPLGEARNVALKHAKGEYIAFLDTDDLWLPRKLEQQLPLFDQHDVGLVYSDAIYFTENGGEERLYDRTPHYTGRCFSQLISNYFLCMQTVVIRRSALENEPYWFDDRFSYIEEADLFRRIGYQWRLAMVNEPLARYRLHASSLTGSKVYLLYDETMAMLETYAERYPGFPEQYEQEIGILKKNVAIAKALYHWKNGSGKDARTVLTPYKLRDYKILMLYIAAFFPEPLLRPLVRSFRNMKSYADI